MRRYHCLYLVVFLFIQINICAQYATSHEVINYSPSDYHAHNQNWQSVQDARGVMYFANGDGILEYDGTFWSSIPSATQTNILSLGIDASGRVYYGGIGEIGYLEPDSEGNLVAKELLSEKDRGIISSEFFWDIHVFDNMLIFRSESYFVSVTDENVLLLEAPNGKTKKSFNTETEVWFQNDVKDIYWFSPQTPEIQHQFTDDKIGNLILQGVYNVREGIKMFVTLESGIYLYDEQKKVSMMEQMFIADYSDINVSYSNYLPNGDLVLCTSNMGVFIVDRLGKVSFHYHEGNGLNTNAIRSAFLDKEGILWFTSNEGISKVLYNIPYTVMLEEGSGLKGISNSIIKHNGLLYVATSEGVFVINEMESFDLEKKVVRKVKNLDWQSFDLAIVGGDLICASPGGIFSIQGDSAIPIREMYYRAICIPEGRIDQMIVGGRDKILFYEKILKDWVVKDSLFDFPDEILHIEQDKSVKDKLVMWAGLYSIGVAKIECEKDLTSIDFKILGKENGVKDGYILPFSIENKMYFAPKEPGGIYNFNATTSTFELDDKITPIFGEDISSWILKEDYYQNIFLENSGPIYVLRKNNNSYKVDSFSLSTLNLGYINDLYIDEEGICWLAGESGIARFNSTLKKEFESEYQILFKKIVVNRDSILSNGVFYVDNKPVVEQQGDIHALSYQLNNLSFEFASLFYNASDRIKYSYKLEGFDSNYSNWAKENKAVYTNLQEGSYIFKVKAKNIYGLESKVLEYRFSIHPPWYRTIWAYLLYVFLAIILIALIVLLISTRLRKANERLQQMIKEKTSEIVEQRDELAQQKEELLERNEEIMDSINYAKRIQNAILPSPKLVKEYLEDSFILYKPKDIVAGDFYWMEHKEGKVLFAAADCTGHGVPGAMVSVICNNGLNRSVREHNLTDPGEILNKTREIIIAEFEKSEEDVKDGMDIALCSLRFNVQGLGLEKTTSNLQPQTVALLQYAGANNPLWIVRNEQILETKPDKQPIGKFDKQTPYVTHVIELQKGDTVYIFSDGYADQFGGPKGKKFKAKAFRNLLLNIQDEPLEKQKEMLNAAFEDWKGTLEQIDDVCVIGVRI